MKFKQFYNIMRIKLLYKLGIRIGLIQDYPKELWKEIEKHYYCGNPVSVLLTNGFNLGKCHDRAYALTMAFDKCNLIRGCLPKCGKTYNVSYDDDPDFEHSWVEDDQYVYDTTFIKRFNKKFYHYLFGSKADAVISSEELNNDDYYMKMKSTTKEDIENSLGFDAANAFLVTSLLEQQEKFLDKDLSYLKCQIPQIDMEEYTRRQNEEIRKIITQQQNEEMEL